VRCVCAACALCVRCVCAACALRALRVGAGARGRGLGAPRSQRARCRSSAPTSTIVKRQPLGLLVSVYVGCAPRAPGVHKCANLADDFQFSAPFVGPLPKEVRARAVCPVGCEYNSPSGTGRWTCLAAARPGRSTCRPSRPLARVPPPPPPPAHTHTGLCQGHADALAG
jgi:hypothetical protein